jgi:carbon monoxide dehydrogenase subunit G
MTVEVSIVVDAPIDRVWAAIEPIEDHVRWMADAESITFTGPSRRGVGTTFECATRIGPFRTVDRMIVTEWEAPHVMGIRHEGLFTGSGRFRLTEVAPARTRFTWTEQIRFPRWLGASVGARAAEPVLRRVWNANLQRLADIVTSHAPGTTS